MTCPKNGSVTIDVIADSNAAGGSGTILLCDGDGPDVPDFPAQGIGYIGADHGVETIDRTTGTITYAPDQDFAGPDEIYLQLWSDNQFKTVGVHILVGGTGSGVTAPAVGSNFSVSDGGTGSRILVDLDAPPFTDMRRFDRVEYSTDGGTTWRRLCFGWIQDAHRVEVESDGTGISPGSYNVMLRYRADYDFVYSGTSMNAPVTVT